MRSPLRVRTTVTALLAAAGLAATPSRRVEGGDPPVAWTPTAPERVTDGYSPRVSPGGKRLAFYRYELDLKTRDERGQPIKVATLYLHELATGAEARAARNGSVAAWSDDDLLVFDDGTTLRIAGEGGEPTFPAMPNAYAPAWGRSRDGRTLAWIGRGDFTKLRNVGQSLPREAVHVLGLGQAARAFAVGDGPDMQGSRGFLAVSPDATRLAMHLTFMHLGQPPHPRIAVLDLTSGTSLFVMDEPYGSSGADDAGTWQSGVATDGVWDGRGERFVFVQTIGASKRDLFTAAGDGTDVRRLTTDGAWRASPCLSPEGERCACWEGSDPAPRTRRGRRRSGTPVAPMGPDRRVLALYHLRTGERVELPLPPAAGGAGTDLHWSRDGTSLWFAWTADDHAGIWRVQAPPPASVAAGTPFVDRSLSPLEDLLASLASEDDDEVEQAIERTPEFTDARVTDALRDVMRRWARNDHRPYPCVEALRARGAVSAIPEFMEELARGEWLDAVSPPLIEWRVTAAIPLWRRVAASGPPTSRPTAAVALARMGEPDGWDLVRAIAATSDADARWSLCTALSRTRDPRSIDVLIPLLADRDEIYSNYTVREAAVRALRALTGQTLGFEPGAWTTWWDGVHRRLPEEPVAEEGGK